MRWLTLSLEATAFWALWSANIPEKMREYWLKYETGSFWHCAEK